MLLVQKQFHIRFLSNTFSLISIPALLRSVSISGGKRALVRGFTLIELLVVITIMAVILGVLLPRFASITTQNLKSDASKVAALVRYLNEAAESRKIFYRLRFDINNGTLRVDKSKDSLKYVKEGETRLSGIAFSDGIDILDISAPGLGKKEKGIVEILLSPYGGSIPFTLHLSTGESIITMFFNPYTGKVTVEDGYR